MNNMAPMKLSSGQGCVVSIIGSRTKAFGNVYCTQRISNDFQAAVNKYKNTNYLMSIYQFQT